MSKNFYLPDEAATENLGRMLAKTFQPGVVVYLVGDLGTGKTTLVRGLLRALGYEGVVKSPTYTLIEHYSVGGFEIYHWDLYRIRVAEELNYMGQSDFFDGRAVHLIEWPEKGGGCIVKADLACSLRFESDGRVSRVSARTRKGKQIMKLLSTMGNENKKS